MSFLRLCTCMVALLLMVEASSFSSSQLCSSNKFEQGDLAANETMVEDLVRMMSWLKDPLFAPYLTSEVEAQFAWCTYSGSSAGTIKVKAVQACDAISGNCTRLAWYNDKKCSEPTLCEGSSDGPLPRMEISCTGLSDEYPNCKMECGRSYSDSCGFNPETTAPAPAPAPSSASSASYLVFTNAGLTLVVGMLMLLAW